MTERRRELSTESISARYAELDLWPTGDAVAAMLEGQLAAAAAVQGQATAIAAAADAAAARLCGPAGRIVYAGAGTSGRLAVLDGVELGPTFGWQEERTLFLLAGGERALTTSVEGAEDDVAAAERAVAEARLGPADVAIGVAASGRTPYTLAVLRAAAAAGALTVGIASNPCTPLLETAAFPILLHTGQEVLAGSTRMKAGTAQKIALNTFSTALMIRLAHVHAGLMVDMRLSNRKLNARAAAMVGSIAKVDEAAAGAALSQAGGRVKLAVLIARGVAPDRAVSLLAETGNVLRDALTQIAPDRPQPS